MVDPILSRLVSTQDRLVASVAPAAQASAPRNRPSEAASKQLELSAIAFDFGGKPPVDDKRVAEVRAAVRNGTYPILPETVADRLLALKLDWNPKK